MANSINPFTIKPPSLTSSSSSSLTSMKLKTLLQTFIFSHMYRLVRAVSKAKSVLIQLLKDIHLIHLVEIFPARKNKKKNLFFGSFRLHYNWGSSHDHNVPIVLESCPNSNSHVYYDSTWSASMLYDEMQDSNELSKYLKWLEEKGGEDCCDEIDRIADLFIANCHEKFRLEKVESYRRFQEMMARSV